MDTHGAATADHGHAEHGHSVPETGERFEKVELEMFVADDQTAGQAIGKLLALVFMISFFLMSGVCIWMLRNTTSDIHDPQAGVGAADVAHH